MTRKPEKAAQPVLLSGGNPQIDEAQFTDWVKQASRIPGARM